jgi:hypothetical protein
MLLFSTAREAKARYADRKVLRRQHLQPRCKWEGRLFHLRRWSRWTRQGGQLRLESAVSKFLRETEETKLAERASHHWDPKPIPRERGMACAYSFLLYNSYFNILFL